jgi:cardiolipin synthase
MDERMPAWFPSVSQHFLVATAALLFYILSARARDERRAPASAIAWVMGLALLPYLMLPLYLLFGQRKLNVAACPIVRPTAADIHWAAALLQSLGLEPPAAVRAQLHANGIEARDALWSVIASARHRLDLCTYLIGNDEFGRELMERLAQRARDGVQVRLLIDGWGGWSAPRESLKLLKQAGAKIVIFKPLFSMRRLGPRNLRNHRKLTIADGQRLWAGGRNLAAEYFAGTADAAPWIDLSFNLEGTVAAAAAAQFDEDWQAAFGEVVPVRPFGPVPVITNGTLAQFLPSGPDQPEDTAHALLIDACFRARRRLLAVTPYFVPDDSLRTAIRLAARRGVKITLMLPARSNHPLPDFVRHRALRDLSAAGANIRMLPGMVHAKGVVVDDTLALCGSINLDQRSLLLNHESAVVFYGAPEINWLARWLEALAATGQDYVPRRPGLLRDVAEGLLLTVAFQL